MHLGRWLALGLLTCAGCAHLPDGKVTYYLTETKVHFKVVRTVACDKDDRLFSSSVVTPSVTHGADVKARFDIPFAELRSIFADSDLKFDFYDDGRLKNVNGTLTGHGEEIFKAITSIASKAMVRYAPSSLANPVPSACRYIEDVNAQAKYKTMTLNYEGDVTVVQTGDSQDLSPDALSQAYATGLNIRGACVQVDAVEKPPAPFSSTHDEQSPTVVARQPAMVQYIVKTGDNLGQCSEEVWRGKVPVAQAGTRYKLPLQKAPVFGKQVFVMSLQESGALSSLQYASTSGTAQALNVVNDALTTAQGQAARQAQAINDEINLMLAQQRLVQCRADPVNCK